MSESSEAKIKRCIIYTRKSTEKGLEQDYNSLDAQRESAENYIKSQNHNGWQLLPTHYDDGGYSGGTTERPALKRLMDDIKAGGIDVIVVYKLDRLSRSLLDFMNLAEFFEQHNVGVISVTQDINTSTSSGRMMLNILMTFCQFEREILVERIKDKIAGAKRRGKYCGGPPILGYNVIPETKKLVVNLEEAKIVQEAFSLYARLGSSLKVIRLLNEKGYRSKGWTSQKSRCHTGSEFTLKIIHRILTNPIYIGMIRHKENIYEGEQDAIIDRPLWDKVQYLLRENCNCEPGAKRNATESPFKGLLVCGYCGGAFGITYSNKKNRRYMYYICVKDHVRGERECPLGRIAAGDLDKIILRQLARIFQAPSMLVKLCTELQEQEQKRRKALQLQQAEIEKAQQNIRDQIHDGGDMVSLKPEFSELTRQMTELQIELQALGEVYSTGDLATTCDSIEAIWEELFPAERYKLAHQVIEKITLYEDRLVMDVKHHGLKSLIRELKTGNDITVSSSADTDVITLTVPVLVKRWNGRKLIVVPDDENYPADDFEPSALAKRLVQGYHWLGMIESGEYPTIARLAEGLRLDPSVVTKTINMVNFSPKIQKLIVEAEIPQSINRERLFGAIPEDWEEQERGLL